MSKEAKAAHDTFRRDAIKAAKGGELAKAARLYEAAIGNCAYVATMLELADLWLSMGNHEKEAREMATRVMRAGPSSSQQKHATKILHRVLEPTAAPTAAPARPEDVQFGSAAAAASASHSPPSAAVPPAEAVRPPPPPGGFLKGPAPEPVLPEGWERVFTPEDEPYYHCIASGETRWDPPPTTTTLAAADAIFAAPSPFEPPAAPRAPEQPALAKQLSAGSAADALFGLKPAATDDAADAAAALFGVAPAPPRTAPQHGAAGAAAAGRPFDAEAEAGKLFSTSQLAAALDQ